MITLSAKEQQRLTDILNYWHKVEFFTPFDLTSYLSKDRKREYLRVPTDMDERTELASLLPGRPPEGKTHTGYKLFMGCFPANRIDTVCQEALGDTSEFQRHTAEERTKTFRETCFAEFMLTPDGRITIVDFKISTVPWALGMVKAGKIDALRGGSFDTAVSTLWQALLRLDFGRIEHDRSLAPPLTLGDLRDLHEVLCNWSGFTPEGDPVAYLQINPYIQNGKSCPEPDTESHPETDPDPDTDTDTEEDDEHEFTILNSFYIQDLEQALSQVASGRIPRTLYEYLTPADPDKRVDIYTEEGERQIIRFLQPENINHGRWLSNPEHAMSLMQQFAVNMTFLQNRKVALFSVNGPPGTGKTTLLRDVVAENVVRRAQMLARLKHPKDAFRGILTSKQHCEWKISVLQESLTGHEMLVASTNNNAVDTISKSLPQAQSIAANWENARYLQSVARNLAARRKKGKITALPEEEECWGLPACPLGNSRNMSKVRNTLFLSPKFQDDDTDEGFQSIFEWLRTYSGPTFQQAKKTFRKAESIVHDLVSEKARFCELQKALRKLTKEEFLAQAEEKRASAREELANLYTELKGVQQRYAEFEEEKRDKAAACAEAKANMPGFLSTWLGKLFGNKNAIRLEAECDVARKELAATNAHLKTLKFALRELEAQEPALLRAAKKAEDIYEQRLATREGMEREFRELLEKHPHGERPVVPADIDSPQVQLEGLWHDERLNAARSELFRAALVLHEAWLAEVGRKGGGFLTNLYAISDLLSGSRPPDKDCLRAIWQSLFMLVPVVSSTFASIQRMLKDLPSGTLGWLLIDEAGQAVPQAAVGALMRANRALVVGDPLQVEPVFTVPPVAVDRLAQGSKHLENGSYSPLGTSVQQLADRANRFGTHVEQDGPEPLWIGSPLRVHRRCIDPMFSLSNAIAYNGKMLSGLSDMTSPDAPPLAHESTWINVTGPAMHKQVVQEQVEFVVRLFQHIADSATPEPDIAVISPFRAVKEAVTDRLKDEGFSSDWLKTHVGTVHTVQGREYDSVIMVLGADRGRQGAVRWAASRPNILNVALTRAKRRFYMVGDYELWGSQRHFSEVAATLPAVSEQAFLEKAAGTANLN